MRTSKYFIIVATALIASCSNIAFAQINYKEECLKLYTAINTSQYDKSVGLYMDLPGAERYMKPYAYLWPVACLYQAANELEVMVPGAKYMDNVWNCIEYYYDSRPPAVGYSSYLTGAKNPKFTPEKIDSRYYDDNQWIGITALDAFLRTGKRSYFSKGEVIYKYMMTGYDTVCTGGLYWQEDHKKSKNTCSNGPAIIIALQMYKATKNKAYLDTAIMLYDWTNKFLKAPDGLYFDNLDVETYKVEKTKFSYNTGTMLQSNVYLYELTKDKKYLDEAIVIANSSIEYFCNKKFRDNLWFEAVLLRGYQHLLKYHKDMKYINAVAECTDDVVKSNMNVNGLVGKDKPIGMVEQAGFVEILARLAVIKK